MTRWTLRISLLFLPAYTALAQTDDDVDPLFASHDILDVTIIAPLTSIMRDRPEVEYLPASFQYLNPDGGQVKFDIGIRTRGNYRRRPNICRFAPLRINFRKQQVAGTLFDNQDKMKLVTHCRETNRYEQSLLQEYLVYRILNLLTDISFRVRLLRVTYIDTEQDADQTIEFAILLEHRDRFAKRIDVPLAETETIAYRRLQPEYANLVALFHYFIGNTDFSQIASAPGEECCHNHELFANTDDQYLSVPYDFDMSGIVDAPYATANPRFNLRNVRERLYRGRCSSNSLVPATVALFFEKRAEIVDLFTNQFGLTAKARMASLRFVDQFFARHDTPKKIQRKLIKECI